MKISLGILLGSTYLSRRWNPSEIFTASEPGLWVDPSAVANLNWRRNLLTYSGSIGGTNWVSTHAPTLNAALAPDGTMTMTRANPASTSSQIYQNATLNPNALYRLSIYAQAGTSTRSRLSLFDSTGSDFQGELQITWVAGVPSQLSVGGSAAGAIFENVGSGVYRISVAVTSDAVNTNHRLQWYSDIVLGTGTTFIWGAQLEVGSTATAYQPITDLNTEVGTLFPNTTLFQDTAGTTPVTTPGQTVALALDRSQGLLVGPELVTNGTFDSATGWTLGTGWSIGGGVAAFNGGGGVSILQNVGLAAGKTYEITLTVATISSGAFRILCGFDTASPNMISAGTYTFRLTRGTNSFIYVQSQGITVGSIDNISVKELAGNHLTQATAASRPVYGIEPAGGRRNLLVRTEEFDNASWVKGNSTITANSTTAPDGSLTADAFIPNSGQIGATLAQSISVGLASHSFSFYAKAFGQSSISLVSNLTGTFRATIFDLTTETATPGTGWSASVVSVGNGWYRCVCSATADVAASKAFQISNNSAGWTGDGTSGIYVWGAQLETGSTATNYQRVTTAFDVTEAGRANMHYLQFDGTDDWMISPTVTPGTDKAQVFAGVRKLSDAASFGSVVELSASAGSNNGAVYLAAPWVGSSFGFASRGTSISNAISESTFPAPITNILTGIGDIANDVATLRVNGVQAVTSATDQGTGNYLAYPIYVGRRGGTTLPFNGRIYQLIVRFGPNLDSEKLNLTELFVGTKTGFYKPIITGIPTWQ